MTATVVDFEARFLARACFEHLGLEASVGRPAQVHAQQHFRPILRVGPARAGVDLEHGVARVVLPVEEGVLLQTAELALE